MRRSPASLIFTSSLVAASFLVVACGGSVVEGNPENTDGGVGGASAGQGGSAPAGSGGSPYAGGSAGYPYAGGSAGYPYAGGSAGWPAGGSAGTYPGGSAGYPYAGGSAGWPAGGSAGAAGGSIFGMIDSLSFKTPFLLDADKLGDDAYVQQHYDGILFDPGFYGWYTYQKASIPSALAEQTYTYGMHQPAMGGSPASVVITQYSIQGQDIVQPYVYLAFTSDNIQPGMVPVGLDADVGAYLVLYHMLNGGSDYCAMAVGFGQLSVIAAQNTTAADGGTIAIGGQAIQLYHPTNTPMGNVSNYVGNVCPIQ